MLPKVWIERMPHDKIGHALCVPPRHSFNPVTTMTKALSVVLATTLLLGCERPTKSGERPATTSAQLSQVKVGIIPIIEVAPLYIGLEKGFFEEEGIDLDLVRMAGGAEILPGVGTGNIDIGFSNVVSLILFHANRSNDFVAFIGGTYETKANVNHALVVRAGQFTWNNAVVGVNTRNNVEELMLLRYLRDRNVAREGINFRAVPFPAMEAALQRGDLHVASLVEPFITKAVDNGFRVLDHQYLRTDRDTVIVATYVTTRSWLQKNPDLATRFMRAFTKSTRFLNNPQNSPEVRHILAEYTSLAPEVIAKMGLPLMVECVAPSRVKAIADELPAFQFLDRPVAVDSLLAETTPRCGV